LHDALPSYAPHGHELGRDQPGVRVHPAERVDDQEAGDQKHDCRHHQHRQVGHEHATSATAAYAFARLRFPGRDRVFVAYLSVLMVPAVVLLIPRFLIINALGWVDTYAGLISTELVSVWGIFLLRQFFLTIPRDLEDAARLV